MKRTVALLCTLLGTLVVCSQNITAKIIDQNTGNPIPFAAIKTGEYHGVISNEEGYFTIHDTAKNQTITISCLGYTNKTLSFQEIANMQFIIPLEEAINELRTVYISNKKPNADSIIARASRNLSKNYQSNLYKHDIFSRETAYMDFDRLDFNIEKASHVKKKNLEQANYSLDSLSKAIINSKTKHFKDFKGVLFMGDSSKIKLTVSKATELMDQKNNLSIEDVQNSTERVILKYLDTTLTYKLKTGLFKIEDSLSLKNKNKQEPKKNDFQIETLKGQAAQLLELGQIANNTMLLKLLDANLYNYRFVAASSFNDERIYIINYSPKRSKAKYTGTLYITDDTYAITRVDFKFAEGKRGNKFNLKLLLGIKYVKNRRQGTVIFQKDSLNRYQPQYLKLEEGRYFYVSRPLKFIENSPKKNKTSFDFTLEGNIMTKQELLLTTHNPITLTDFKTVSEAKTAPYITLHSYDASIWKDNQTLEPSTEMKTFKGED